MTTDLELLHDYVTNGAEESFTALVARHTNLVFSAALRQVRSRELAEEVAQSAFDDLARSAPNLQPDTVLTAWLYQVARRTATDVLRRESRRQRREQIATEMNRMNATDAPDPAWMQIEPLLDDAMEALDETDRAAVLLRYFENKPLRQVGQTLGTTDDAAQKRVSRAVERLREFFAKRGVTIGGSGLVLLISANAVQAAPAGLAAALSAGAVATPAIATVATTTTAKTMTMTGLQKALITAGLLLAGGAVTVALFSRHQTTLPPVDLVRFFQSAISSPPDVEHFVATQTTLREGPLPANALRYYVKPPVGPASTMGFEGAKLGENFFLVVSATNYPARTPNTVVWGRAGEQRYFLNENTLDLTSSTRGTIPDALLVSQTDTQFRYVLQFLMLGLNGIDPTSVNWSGNEFTARWRDPVSVPDNVQDGRLDVSNGLPSAVTLSSARTAKPYKMVSYEYPSPPQALAGFPARIVLWQMYEDGLHPSMELVFLRVQLAKHRLKDNFFAPGQFVTKSILYTNIYGNGTETGISPRGTLVRHSSSPDGTEATTDPDGARHIARDYH